MSGAWKSEADLVADFTAWAQKAGWIVYAETAGWDVLLVRPEDGFQIGVEAKLSLNATVLCQVLSREHSYTRGTGPDCVAALAPRPKTVTGMAMLARHLGIVVVEAFTRATPKRVDGQYVYVDVVDFSPALPSRRAWDHSSELDSRGWPERCPDKRHPLPDYVPDVTGGHASPVALTEWKIKAIKIAIILETRGWVTRADFRALNIDPSRWTQFWLKSGGDGRWLSHCEPNFKAQHPVNYEQIKADLPTWGKAVAGLITAEDAA